MESVVNVGSYVAGQLAESDVEFRKSYTNKIYNRSSAMLESIKSAILKNVQGVVSVAPYENCTNEVDSAGRWPHSIEVVVEGGDATEIAQQILNTKAGGINTFGSVETTLHGVYGEDIVVRFNRPTYVKVWFKVGVTLSPNTNPPTNYIELVKEQILEKMAGQTVEVHGSGRTDAGVHAWGQVANFHLPASCAGMSAEELKAYLNRYLPDDIAVLSAQEAGTRFHSRLNAVSKTYCYRIETAAKKNVFERRYVYGLGEPLDIASMRRAAAYLTGEHDFKAFCSLKRMKKSTVRNLTAIELTMQESVCELHFRGNGFLYNMVRILTGTLIEVGLHKRTPESVAEALFSCDRALAGFTAPPEGLFLERVEYE